MDFRSQLKRMKFSLATKTKQSNDPTKPIWLIFSPGTMTGKTLQNIEKKVLEGKKWEDKSVGEQKLWEKKKCRRKKNVEKKVWEKTNVEKKCGREKVWEKKDVKN